MEEPSIHDSIEVLRGVRGYYEKYHCVRVPDPIVASVVQLSERYITDAYLPDKAIDLLDEACAAATCATPKSPSSSSCSTHCRPEEQEHTLENPDPDAADSSIDYEELARIKTELARERERLPRLSCALPISRSPLTMWPRLSNYDRHPGCQDQGKRIRPPAGA